MPVLIRTQVTKAAQICVQKPHIPWVGKPGTLRSGLTKSEVSECSPLQNTGLTPIEDSTIILSHYFSISLNQNQLLGVDVIMNERIAGVGSLPNRSLGPSGLSKILEEG